MTDQLNVTIMESTDESVFLNARHSNLKGEVNFSLKLLCIFFFTGHMSVIIIGFTHFQCYLRRQYLLTCYVNGSEPHVLTVKQAVFLVISGKNDK